MARPVEALSYAKASAKIGVATGGLLGSLWRSDGAWIGKVQRAALIVAAGQIRAASLASDYAASYGATGELELVPSAFGGLASDGRPLDSLLVGASFAATAAASRVDSTADALTESTRAAQSWLLMVARTQVADAGRAALRSSMAAYDMTSIRVANPPCCPRCAILAGQVSHWMEGFQRHPGCDCTMQPTAQGNFISMDDDVPMDQIRGLSKADREAIEMGANINDVVNAQRGMYTAEMYGKRLKATTESTTQRSSAFPGRDHPNTPRLRPEAIMKYADGDRDEAVRLLTRYGYMR